MERVTTTVPTTESFPKYLGNNQKQIMVVVSSEGVPFVTNKDLNFLTSILSACGLSLADIALINLSNTAVVQMHASIEQIKSKTVLLFGLDPLHIGLPINFPTFQLQQFSNRTYLYAPALSVISSDKALKANLWSSLKSLFKL